MTPALLDPPPPRVAKPRRQPNVSRRVAHHLLLVCIGVGLGLAAALLIRTKDRSVKIEEELGTRVKPGPWGELYTVPFAIAAPDELLPIRALEERGTHWLFKNSTLSEVANILETAGVSADQRAALLAPPVAETKGIDLELSPTPEMVLALPESARLALYRTLAQVPENRSAFYFIHKDTIHDRFADSGVSPDTLALFHALCCEHGDYLVFGGLPALLAKVPNYDEKLRFTKALTRQKTMLIRLRVGKDFDVKAAGDYWGKGVWAPNIRAILEGVERVSGGTFVSIVPLLPPLPASQAYFYPITPGALPGGVPMIRDCHWTSLNFFRDPADAKPVVPADFGQLLSTEFFPITGDPRYGDIVILTAPSGEILHSAIFIADEIVFTKNGATAIYPWMFSTISDLLKQYSFQAAEGQQLTVRYFRNRST